MDAIKAYIVRYALHFTMYILAQCRRRIDLLCLCMAVQLILRQQLPCMH
jgi:hypothetical protein